MSFKIGDSAEGGIVFSVDETGEHGLVAAEMDQGHGENWYDAQDVCSKLVLNGRSTRAFDGYNDWFLPSAEQLDKLYRYFKTPKTKVDFIYGYYWSTDDRGMAGALMQHFGSGEQVIGKRDTIAYVRAIRKF
jgi:hypothetical protein